MGFSPGTSNINKKYQSPTRLYLVKYLILLLSQFSLLTFFCTPGYSCSFLWLDIFLFYFLLYARIFLFLSIACHLSILLSFVRQKKVTKKRRPKIQVNGVVARKPTRPMAQRHSLRTFLGFPPAPT